MMGLAQVGAAAIDVRLNDLQYRNSLNRLESSTQSALGRIANQFTYLGKVLSVSVTTPLAALAGVGIRSAMQLETFAATLRVLIGDADRANAVFEELYQFSAETPFDWRTLTEGTRVLTAFGVQAEHIVPTLARLGDISAGLQTPLNEMAEIYGRVLVTGRLSMQEINSLAQRGVPIFTELADQLGVTAEEVREMASNGVLGFSNLQNVIMSLTSEGGKFFGMMDEQTLTVAGRLNRLKDTFEMVTDTVGERLIPTFDKLISLGQQASEWFTRLNDSTQGLIVGLGVAAATAGPLLVALGGFLRILPQLQAGLAALRLMGLASFGPVGWVIGGIAAVAGLVAALSGGGGKSDSLAAAIEAVDTTITSADALNNFDEVFDNLAETLAGPVRRAFTGFKDDIWEIVSAAEDARAALAAIQAGARLAETYATSNTLRNVTPVRIDGGPQPEKLIRDSLMRGQFEEALVLIDEVLVGLQEIDLAMSQGGSGGRGSSAAVREMEDFRDAVAGAQEAVDKLMAPRATLDLGGTGSNGGAMKAVRTLQDVLDELDRLGTFEMRWAAFKGGGLEEQLTAAQNRATLIDQALQEIIRDFFGEASDELLEQLRQRQQNAEREAKDIITRMGANSIQAMPTGPLGANPERERQLQRALEAATAIQEAGGKVAQFIGLAKTPVEEFTEYLRELSQVPGLPAGALTEVNTYLKQLEILEEYGRIYGERVSQQASAIAGLGDPLEQDILARQAGGATPPSLTWLDRGADAMERVGRIGIRLAEMLGKAKPETEIETMLRDLRQMSEIPGLPAYLLRDIESFIAQLESMQRVFATLDTSNRTLSELVVGVPDADDLANRSGQDDLLRRMQNRDAAERTFGQLGPQAERVLGRLPDDLTTLISSLEELSTAADIDPYTLREVTGMLSSLRALKAHQDTQGPRLPDGVSSIAGITENIGAGRNADALQAEIEAAMAGADSFNQIFSQAAQLMGTAPTQVEMLVEALERLSNIPRIASLIGTGADDLIADLTAWQEQQDLTAAQTDEFMELNRALGDVSDTTSMLAGHMDPVLAQLQALLAVVTDPDLAARIQAVIDASTKAKEQAEQAAADSFANTVVSAGFQFGEGVISAIKSGKIETALAAALRGAQSIFGASNLGSIGFLGGSLPIGALISGALGLIGALIQGGGKSRQDEERALQERMSRTTPALTFNVSVIQNNNYGSSNADPVIRADNDRRTRDIVYQVFQEVGYANLRDRALGNV